jgi:tRNA (Thr-GGU) A37 N-methylase
MDTKKHGIFVNKSSKRLNAIGLFTMSLLGIKKIL